MKVTSMIEILNRIKILSLSDNIYDLIASSSEELGEVAKAVLVEDGKKWKKKKKQLKESSASESVDLTICALAMFYNRGGTDAELIRILEKKLNKWENNV